MQEKHTLLHRYMAVTYRQAMHGFRVGDRGLDPTEKSQKFRVSQQYWTGSPEILNATKPALNVRPSSARQRNAILMAFRWRADDGWFLVVFGTSLL